MIKIVGEEDSNKIFEEKKPFSLRRAVEMGRSGKSRPELQKTLPAVPLN